MKALMTTDTLLILRTQFVFFGDRPAASVTLIKPTAFQIVIDRYPVIEYKAFALPQALLLRNLLEVLENAAFQVVNLVKTLLFQVCRRFFTTNATCAEHGHFLVLCRIQILAYVFGELPERIRGRINSVFERANFHLVLIAGIHQQYIGA